MLDSAFLHFSGIGKKSRDKLFQNGIIDWETGIKNSENIPFKGEKKNKFIEELHFNLQALKEERIGFFAEKLHPLDKWRILLRYFEKASYFDIETDGFYNRITTISLYHKGKIYNFTKYKNLDDFLDILDDVELMVSFNGGSFDVPVVLQNFRIPRFPVPHVDLRWVCYHEGIRGGLKEIERKLNILRPRDLAGVDGMDAIRLWVQWIEWKDKQALEKLIRYCSADVLSLVKLTEKILSRKVNTFQYIDDGSIWDLLKEGNGE